MNPWSPLDVDFLPLSAVTSIETAQLLVIPSPNGATATAVVEMFPHTGSGPLYGAHCSWKLSSPLVTIGTHGAYGLRDAAGDATNFEIAARRSPSARWARSRRPSPSASSSCG